MSDNNFKSGSKYIEGNKPWERKPHDTWPEFRDEDLFLCHKCNGWWSWPCYNKGRILALPYDKFNTYLYMNDDEDRVGIRWSCNYCLDKILYYNNIITITNIDC